MLDPRPVHCATCGQTTSGAYRCPACTKVAAAVIPDDRSAGELDDQAAVPVIAWLLNPAGQLIKRLSHDVFVERRSPMSRWLLALVIVASLMPFVLVMVVASL